MFAGSGEKTPALTSPHLPGEGTKAQRGAATGPARPQLPSGKQDQHRGPTTCAMEDIYKERVEGGERGVRGLCDPGQVSWPSCKWP